MSGRRWPATHVVVGAAAIGVFLRVVIRLAGGETAFLDNSYRFYLTLAENVVSGVGFCYGPGESCALRMPLYPLFLSPFVASGLVYPAVIIAQAMLGGLLVWITFVAGRELFDERAAVVAAIATALNPYAVVHDTSLQDTVLINVLMLGALALLLHAARRDRAGLWWSAGLVLALAIMTSARLVVFVPLAIGWGVAAVAPRRRLRTALALSLPVIVLAGGWMIRNWRLTGAPVLTMEGGEALYFGNSPLTFMYFPEESIDLVAGEIEHLPAEAQAMLEPLGADDPARDRIYRQWAIAYARSHPLDVAWGAIRKLWVVASAQLSPERGALVQWGYRLTFLALHVLAMVGAVRARGRGHVLAALMVAAFAVTTAVFWAHTSHKSYLDALTFIYAAAGVRAWRS